MKPSIVALPSLNPVECPCGWARRAFADQDHFPGTVHLTEISRNAIAHYHKTHTEVYIILQCAEDAQIELDGERQSIKPLDSILIPPGVRHRAIGEMNVIVISSPAFDPTDEHFD